MRSACRSSPSFAIERSTLEFRSSFQSCAKNIPTIVDIGINLKSKFPIVTCRLDRGHTLFVRSQGWKWDGDTAHCETYCTYLEIRSNPPRTRRVGGRYIDRFERRDGRWGIAARALVIDWVIAEPGGGAEQLMPTKARPALPPKRDRSDQSYMRPLVIQVTAEAE